MRPGKRESSAEETSAPAKMSVRRVVTLTLLHLLGMVAAGVLIVLGALYFLDLYTHHGEAVKVPDLTGMTLEEAQTTVKSMDLTLDIVDSIYTEGEAPGVILKTTPRAGSVIKKHRTLFLTTNTISVERVRVPSVYDTSRRRAEAALRAAGFVDVTVKLVPGRYNDLAVEVLDRATGLAVPPGSELPYNTPLVLSVTSTASLDSLLDAEAARPDSTLLDDLGELSDEDLPEL